MGSLKQTCIGIDQSYKNTGVSIAVDGKLASVSSIRLDRLQSKPLKRTALRDYLESLLDASGSLDTKDTVCVIERIRTFSQGFISTDYIKSIGALNAVIIDTMYRHGIEVYSIDTRAWKSGVIGTSKPEQNKYGISDKKWPTIKWLYKNHREFWEDVVTPTKKKKGVMMYKGVKYEINDDACDSAAIALSWSVCTPDKFKLEL